MLYCSFCLCQTRCQWSQTTGSAILRDLCCHWGQNGNLPLDYIITYSSLCPKLTFWPTGCAREKVIVSATCQASSSREQRHSARYMAIHTFDFDIFGLCGRQSKAIGSPGILPLSMKVNMCNMCDYGLVQDISSCLIHQVQFSHGKPHIVMCREHLVRCCTVVLTSQMI